VSDLSNSAVGFCKRDQFVGFGKRPSDWLFDQDVDAGFHQLPRNCQVVSRGHCYGYGLDLAVGGDELFDRSKRTAVKFLRDRFRAREI
jgi:hypothetical protein